MKRVSEFKKHKAKVDVRHAPLERDWAYWIEHVAHWHLAFLGIALVLLFTYLLFDPRAPVWASF
jgi:hypothetical protein